jgi:anaerobic selenocysteine-containing dehydrogenase
VVSVRGDYDSPLTQGYVCVKGIEAPAAMYGENRILHPLKRVGDTHVRIDLEQALDEIAERMRAIIDADGASRSPFTAARESWATTCRYSPWQYAHCQPEAKECSLREPKRPLHPEEVYEWH